MEHLTILDVYHGSRSFPDKTLTQTKQSLQYFIEFTPNLKEVILASNNFLLSDTVACDQVKKKNYLKKNFF